MPVTYEALEKRVNAQACTIVKQAMEIKELKETLENTLVTLRVMQLPVVGDGPVATNEELVEILIKSFEITLGKEMVG